MKKSTTTTAVYTLPEHPAGITQVPTAMRALLVEGTKSFSPALPETTAFSWSRPTVHIDDVRDRRVAA